ncbi:hypothetical protein QIS99_04400 [Streptomyces sp. B-S-A8]|uniref:Uncharacterized protein n=1 Tax=Streptomyces solicavernae TaxID=3043614 RepID=A0ABT6RLZ4_9ACTN|nr:hypothetical protein [Streptomyces sp. B-S-A8]MDI3385458.1 hypothetical protein [Streptomyces sp. B-S-A8]
MTRYRDDRLEWWLGDACTITRRLPELDVAYSMFGYVETVFHAIEPSSGRHSRPAVSNVQATGIPQR